MRKLLLISALALLQLNCSPQSLRLASNGASDWKIFADPSSRINAEAAKVLQDYFNRVTGVQIPISSTWNKSQSNWFVIGSNIESDTKQLRNDGYTIRTHAETVAISGFRGKSVLYGVYAFIEKYLGCRKWDEGKAFVPHNASLTIPSSIDEKHEPILQYRESYFPPSFDDEYLNWHALHRFEEKWGLWGHSFFKLVPPNKYFKAHPEYYSLINGKREPIQLCLSNSAVLQITIDELKQKMQDNPDAQYWSVSPNDDIGPCECENCKKLDAKDGGAQGSLLHFVNAVAGRFPNKTITTLAYGYTSTAPLFTKAAANVAVMLSTINAYRSRPLETEPSAASFRKDLQQWKSKCDHLFVWDYCTQFTNYLTPFPVEKNIAHDLDYLTRNNITGIFSQGSGETYGDMAELKSYVFAKLSFDASLNADLAATEFINGYYGKAAPYVRLLLQEMRSNIKKDLDIYGNPVNRHDDYLSPAFMDRYSTLMDQAEVAVANDVASSHHVQKLRLSQEYTFLQQCRFYGKGTHGIYVENENGDYIARPGLYKRVERFGMMSSHNNVKELTEGGITLAAYIEEWNSILAKPIPVNLAAHAKVSLQFPFAPEYPAKKEETLVDETPGYKDFSYNWLCFYNEPMVATVDMNKIKSIRSIKIIFLQDARHWIFHPSSVSVELSEDGVHFKQVQIIQSGLPDEDYEVSYKLYKFAVAQEARFIRVRAENQTSLPSWRYHKTKKPMIACDEIWVD